MADKITNATHGQMSEIKSEKRNAGKSFAVYSVSKKGKQASKPMSKHSTQSEADEFKNRYEGLNKGSKFMVIQDSNAKILDALKQVQDSLPAMDISSNDAKRLAHISLETRKLILAQHLGKQEVIKQLKQQWNLNDTDALGFWNSTNKAIGKDANPDKEAYYSNGSKFTVKYKDENGSTKSIQIEATSSAVARKEAKLKVGINKQIVSVTAMDSNPILAALKQVQDSLPPVEDNIITDILSAATNYVGSDANPDTAMWEARVKQLEEKVANAKNKKQKDFYNKDLLRAQILLHKSIGSSETK